MPRLTVALLVLTALAPAAAAAGAPPSRQAQATYAAPGGVDGAATISAGGQGSTLGVATLPVRAGERRVTLRIADNSGRPVAADVVQVLNEETGAFTTLGRICGTAPATYRLSSPTAPVAVRPVVGSCADTVSVPTQGLVTARFLRS